MIAEDDGRAFLLHPALERFYPPARRIVIPERLTECGGVMLAEALDVLVKELKYREMKPHSTIELMCTAIGSDGLVAYRHAGGGAGTTRRSRRCRRSGSSRGR